MSLGLIVISSKLNVNVGKRRESGELRDVSMTSFCLKKSRNYVTFLMNKARQEY